MKMMKTFLGFLALAAAAAQAAVVDLTPDNFDAVVNGDKAVLVEFYAPWCGHCKNLAPEYEIAGETFKAGDGVVIAKVDADKERSLGERFEVKGFPTIKWFPKGSTTPEEYTGGRDAEGIVKFVNDKTGLTRKVKKSPSAVVDLTPSSFDSVVNGDKHVFLEFYAPWCGHCKSLAPKYEAFAKIFAGEPDVVIAKVDANEHRELGTRFEVSGFPTLKFVPKGSKEPVPYEGGREVGALVAFMNDKAGLAYTADGGLKPSYGRVEAMDALLSAAGGSITTDRLEKLQVAAKGLEAAQQKFGDLYVKVAEKVLAKGAGYVGTELERLSKLIDGGSITPDRKAAFLLKANVLKAFKGEPATDVTEEL